MVQLVYLVIHQDFSTSGEINCPACTHSVAQAQDLLGDGNGSARGRLFLVDLTPRFKYLNTAPSVATDHDQPVFSLSLSVLH